MVHDEEQEVLKSLCICEKTGVKGRHTRAEFLETERIERVGWLWKVKEGQNCSMPQRERHPESPELCTVWPSFTQPLSKPISFLLSEQHGQPHPTQFLLANAGAPKPSLTLLKFLLACLPIHSVMDHHREDPKIGQLSANCLSTPVEMEAGLSLRIVSHHHSHPSLPSHLPEDKS